MSNDDPRGERPERRHASSRSTQDGAADGSRSAPDRRTDGDTTVSVRARLEKIVDLTGSVLTDVRNPDATIGCEDIDEETRRDAKRRLREIDAETRRVGLVLFGPDGTLSDGRPATPRATCRRSSTAIRSPPPIWARTRVPSNGHAGQPTPNARSSPPD